MQHESRPNKPNNRGGTPQRGGEASAVARACKFLLFSARGRGAARLVGVVGVAEGRVTARALPREGAWCAPVIINRCRSLPIAQFAPGSGTASHRSENEYCVPSPVSPDVAAAAHPGYGTTPPARRRFAAPSERPPPGEGKGRLGSCLNLNQLPRGGPTPPPPRSKNPLPCKHMPRPADWHGPCESVSVARFTLIMAAGTPPTGDAGSADQPG